jgi:hypothetical protein
MYGRAADTWRKFQWHAAPPSGRSMVVVSVLNGVDRYRVSSMASDPSLLPTDCPSLNTFPLLAVEALLISSFSLIRHFKVDILPNFQRCVLLQLFSCTTSLSITTLFYWLSVAHSITTTLLKQDVRTGLSWCSYWQSSPYWISCLSSFSFSLPHFRWGVMFEREQLYAILSDFASTLLV